MSRLIIAYKNTTSSNLYINDLDDTLALPNASKELSQRNNYDDIISSKMLYSHIDFDRAVLVLNGKELDKADSIKFMEGYFIFLSCPLSAKIDLSVGTADVFAGAEDQVYVRWNAEDEYTRCMLDLMTVEVWLYRYKSQPGSLTYPKTGQSYKGPKQFVHPTDVLDKFSGMKWFSGTTDRESGLNFPKKTEFEVPNESDYTNLQSQGFSISQWIDFSFPTNDRFAYRAFGYNERKNRRNEYIKFKLVAYNSNIIGTKPTNFPFVILDETEVLKLGIKRLGDTNSPFSRYRAYFT